MGTDENVTIYSNYDVRGECYKTKIKSNDEGSYNNYMFTDNTTVKSIVFQKGIDTSNVTSMNRMFDCCSKLTSLDLSNLDTSNVTDMSIMFNECKSLTSLDLSNFDTSNVTNMYNMFRNCSSLTSLDLSNCNTSKVTNMYMMFCLCESLTSLDLSNFDTSKVTNMQSMFNGCSSLTAIYVTNDKWIINENCDTTNMFYNCGCSEVTYKDVA